MTKFNAVHFNSILLILVLLGIIIFIACSRNSIEAPDRSLKEPVIVTRFQNGTYVLDFAKKGEWKIFSGKSRKTIDWTKPLAVIDGEQAEFPEIGKDGRVFFGLVSPENEIIIASERRIYLKNTPNFRDLGGLRTEDGRVVKWGEIYRSSKLSDLEAEDLLYLKMLGIKTVCDFRYDSEINKDPNRLPKGVDYYKFPIGGKEGVEYHAIRRQVIRGDIRKLKAKKKFIEIMQLFADSAAHDFKPVMDLLVQGDKTPLVFHCSGGKDRTGFMASIILAALGVDEKTVKEEYLMSNFYRYRANRSGARKARLIGIDSETLHYAFVVQEEYIDGVFDSIREKYGDLNNYLEIKFGLTEPLRQRLRDLYTYQPLDYNVLFEPEDDKKEAKM